MRTPWLLLLALSLPAVAGCDESKSGSGPSAATSAAPIVTAECAVCNMVVREQPAPRAQAVHRDGHRMFACSISEVVDYLRIPSPHGKVGHVFVETMDPGADPKTTDPGARPWIHAEKGHYVLGVPRKGVMGKPVLVYEKAADAKRIANAHKVEAFDWKQLQAKLARP